MRVCEFLAENGHEKFKYFNFEHSCVAILNVEKSPTVTAVRVHGHMGGMPAELRAKVQTCQHVVYFYFGLFLKRAFIIMISPSQCEIDSFLCEVDRCRTKLKVSTGERPLTSS